MTPLSRRSALFTLAATLAAATLRPALAEAATPIRVAKDPNCGCCGAWVEILESQGFAATIEEMEPGALQDHKLASGIPAAMASCHTAHVEGYAIEGHVPPPTSAASWPSGPRRLAWPCRGCPGARRAWGRRRSGRPMKST